MMIMCVGGSLDGNKVPKHGQSFHVLQTKESYYLFTITSKKGDIEETYEIWVIDSMTPVAALTQITNQYLRPEKLN